MPIQKQNHTMQQVSKMKHSNFFTLTNNYVCKNKIIF